MNRFSKVFFICTIAVGCLALLFVALATRKSGRAIFFNGKLTDTSRVDTEALEHEVRTGLPMGCSLGVVQEFLAKRDIEHSFEPSSKTVYAIVNKLKGGSIFASKSLTFQFRFDDSLKLQSTNTLVLYTGP
jgi:hypothetical protein